MTSAFATCPLPVAVNDAPSNRSGTIPDWDGRRSARLVADGLRIRHTFPASPSPVRTVQALLIALFWLASAAVHAQQDGPAVGPVLPNPPPEGVFDAPPPPAEPPAPAVSPPPTAEAPTLAPESVPAAPIVPEARPATPLPLTTPPPVRTQWTPFGAEITKTAAGSMEVCSTVVLPLTIIPGVGDIIGTIADWFCIIPSAVAIDHTGAFNGNRSSDFWQPALALILKKSWETLIDTPIFVGTVAVIVALAAGGIAVRVYAGIPVSVLTAGAIAVTLGVYTGLKAAREGVGDFLFLTAYNVLVPEGDEGSSALARERSTIQPGVSGVPATFGLVATVGGSRAAFAWGNLLPVVGPIWKAEAQGKDIKQRTHRYIEETMQVNKHDLSGMDGTADVLSAVQGWSMAAGQVGIGLGLAFVGAGVVLALDDPGDPIAEGFGIAGLIAAAGGAVGVAVSYGAEKLQPVAVPLAYAMSE